MKMMAIWMSEKWVKMKAPDENFVNDMREYGKYIKKDYKKLGLPTELIINKKTGAINLIMGTDETSLGFLETHKIFRIEPRSDMSSVNSPFIQKHLITITGIYMLLNKYGYIKNYMPNYIMLDEMGDEVIQGAQAELINLQLI